MSQLLFRVSIIRTDRSHQTIALTLPDGATKEGISYQTTPLDIAKSISKGLAEQCIVAKV